MQEPWEIRRAQSKNYLKNNHNWRVIVDHCNDSFRLHEGQHCIPFEIKVSQSTFGLDGISKKSRTIELHCPFQSISCCIHWHACTLLTFSSIRFPQREREKWRVKLVAIRADVKKWLREWRMNALLRVLAIGNCALRKSELQKRISEKIYLYSLYPCKNQFIVDRHLSHRIFWALRDIWTSSVINLIPSSFPWTFSPQSKGNNTDQFDTCVLQSSIYPIMEERSLLLVRSTLHRRYFLV